jgi:2'-5' RNA ligase
VQGSDFRPHLTVGRTRGDAILTAAVDELTALLQHDPVTWFADDLCLVSSVRGPGATYDVLERWQLPPGS